MTTLSLLRCLIGGRGSLNIISPLSVIQTNYRSQLAVLGLFSNHEQTREMSRVKRRKTHPFFWHRKKILRTPDDQLSSENTLFLKEFLHEKYSEESSPLKGGELVKTEWNPNTRRTGVIARNIGVYPMWKKDGTRIICTLLEVLDNHVIRYIPPEDYIKTRIGEQIYKNRKPKGCLVVGAEATAPSKFTKQYCNLFREAGVMPKKRLMKFIVTPNAALPVGTPISAGHFVVGQSVDIIGKTIDRGFQGVMKRWGFAGGPASHGATKFHRKGGTIGHGRNKSRVYPGTKMPGHMGSERRALLGVTIMRINLKHNVIYVQGPIQGGTNSIVKICDTILPHKKLKEAPPHPTYFPPEDGKLSEEDIHDSSLHRFGTPTIMATA